RVDRIDDRVQRATDNRRDSASDAGQCGDKTILERATDPCRNRGDVSYSPFKDRLDSGEHARHDLLSVAPQLAPSAVDKIVYQAEHALDRGNESVKDTFHYADVVRDDGFDRAAELAP